ncbi:MAG: T9SS type A sorting domain-containing protein [Saprospirales bacterium]|nr:T9SS type A sorting domain-containing protein [Saprospirales bacterium]
MKKGIFTLLLPSLFVFGALQAVQAQVECAAEAEFSYDASVYCTNGDNPVITLVGQAGAFSYLVLSGGSNLALNASTGDIDVAASDPGTYQVTNSLTIGAELPEMVITGIVDGPLTGGIPKAVEFFVLKDIPDLSLFGFGSANNGGGTDGVEFTFPAVAVSKGTYITVATDAASFLSFFGVPPTYTNGTAPNINGDDAIELFKNGVVIDVFGDINMSGTGQPWDYMDGWVYRVADTGPDGSTFVLGNWIYSGINALDGETSNATAAIPFPIFTYTNTCSSAALVITGVLDGNLSGGLPKAIEFFVVNDIPNLSLYGFGSANNGGGTDGQEFTFPAVPASAGDYIYVGSEAVSFQAFFGFPPDYTTSAAAVNGDDAIELFGNSVVIDVFGDINMSGTGQPWEYMDGWAYRVAETGPDGSTFVLANWFFSGPNALDPATSNANANPPFPLGTYTLTCAQGGQIFVCDQIITINLAPEAVGGPDQVLCGGSVVALSASGTGTWSGGLGTFSNINDPAATYTPAPSEIGTTIQLTWTAEDSDGPTGPCTSASDDVFLTLLPEADAEFSYDAEIYCPNGTDPVLSHTTGTDGLYTYSVVSGGPVLNLNPQNGAISLAGSDRGTYEVTNTVSGSGNLVISGIVDGNIPGGLPKAVEFTALADIPNLSNYGFGSANNGGGSDGIEFFFPADAVAQGTHIWVATEYTVFEQFFGFPPTYVDGFASSINGDDAIELFCNGQVIDVFGDINMSGIGQPWEYTDGWAYRVNNTGPDGPVFHLENWFFSGPNALDPATTNANANPPFPEGTFTSNLGGSCPNAVYTQTITIDDTEGPVFDCPANIILNLDPGACDGFVNFTVTATDNCDPDPVITQTSGCPCNSFNIGEETVSFEATDIYGNVSTCSFTVTVLEFPNPVQTLACNDLVQISLDMYGTAIIGADDILEGGPYGCYDDYIVNILNSFGFPIGNAGNCSYIGQVWDIQVMDPETGNKCWGTVTFEDKLAPQVLCNEVTINCSVDYNNVPFPLAIDNCDPFAQIEMINQEILDGALCDEGYVTVLRTFIAFDNYGNESEPCTQTITILRPQTVDFPDDIQWECDDYAQFPNITNATPLTGNLASTGSGIPGGLDGQYCMYGYIFADEVLAACGNSFKIVRTWTVLDWCTGGVVTFNQTEDNVQIIMVLDTTPPSVELDPFTVNANIPAAHPEPCRSTGFLLPAAISDNCNTWTVRIFTPAGEADYVNGVDGAQGGFIPAPGLGLGTYQILYQVEDACNNLTELYVTVEVVDGIVPTAICDEITDVNVTSDGLAIVYAETFDDGSYDNCCLDFFQARRMNGDCEGGFDDFGPTVEFCCSDAGQAVVVVFRAVDCFGNFNDCMVSVNVNDKVPPSLLSCPQGQTITCDKYLDDYAAAVAQGDYSLLEGFGTPTFFDNCNYNLNYTVAVNLDNCSKGTIVRTWVASDSNGSATCTQTINVTHVSDWVVEFPADFTGECINGQLPDTGEPQIFHDECELIGVSHEDQLFTVVPDACYKIERTWNVINWCIYDDFGYNAYSETGKAECNLNADWDGDGDKDCRTFRDGYNSTGSPGTPDGFISFKQIIKVIDNEAPGFTIPDIDGCIVATNCVKTLILPYPDITDDCSLAFDVNITGDFGDFDNISADVSIPNVGIGEYEVTYSITDNCGNTGYQTITVVVEDCKKPTAYCVNGLVIEIMQTGMVEAWASDFDAGSYDNCGPVQLSFSPDVNDINHIYTCDDLGQQVVTMWVTDESGNQDYCETFLIVQDNMNACNAVFVALGGNISTEENEPVEDVEINANGGMFMTNTDMDGAYVLTVPEGSDYSVSALYDVAPSNGVTTWDIVLISRHILGVQPLTSPFKIIAADANHNESVTTLDMVAIRKVILQLETSFQNNTSWRFVDKDFVFPNPANPFQTVFPEVINFNNLGADHLFADFVAIKVGDVNSSAATSLTGDAEERSMEGTLGIQVADQELTAGKTFRVDFRAQEADLYGFQFTLNFDPQALEFAEFLPGVVGSENIGLALLEEGAITMSWNTAEATALHEGDILFSVIWNARTSAPLSRFLTLNSRFTEAEAYNSTSGRLNVDLYFLGQPENATFALYQNAPNPFTGVTTIGFHLPEAAPVTVTVMDLSGRTVKLFRGDFGKGYNEIQLNELNNSGVYYYRLDTPTHSATRKLVVQ